MKKIRSFVKTTLLGGLVVILPATIVAAVFKWLYSKVTGWIQPLTDVLTARAELREFAADLIVIVLILTSCFLLGLVIKTTGGRWMFNKLEDKVLKVAPGYNLVKETVAQFLGRKKSPFSSVALVQLFENQTLATAFVTEEHENGSFSVFVPTGPNPTSGQIFHLRPEFVHPVSVGVDEAMRSIISCGAGSRALLEAFEEKKALVE